MNYYTPSINDLQKFPDFVQRLFIPDLDIYDAISSLENIKRAHKFARRRKSKYNCVKRVDKHPELLEELALALQNETYKIENYNVSILRDHKKERTLLKSDYWPHRITQWGIMLHLEPLFMRGYHICSCASIKERGIDWAFGLTKSLMRESEYTHILKIDIQKFFQSIDHEILKDLLVAIPEIRASLRTQNLLFHIIDSVNGVPDTGFAPGKGVPIGSYISQYLANLYLTPLDRFLESGGFKFVRYMDDVIIFGLAEELCELKYFLRDKFVPGLRLSLKGNYQVYKIDPEGIDFVGYRFYRLYQKIRKSTALRAKRHLNTKNAPSYYGIAKRSNSCGFIRRYFDASYVKRFLDSQPVTQRENLRMPEICKFSL